MREVATQIVIPIIANPALAFAPKGSRQAIDNPEDLNTHYQLDENQNGYRWKLQLFINNEEQANTVIYISFNDDGVEGKIVSNIENEQYQNKLSALPQSENLAKPSKLEVHFGGNTNEQYFEIKLTQDMQEVYAYATQNWDFLTNTEKELLDITQPQNVLLDATLQHGIYSIVGSSYNLGWTLENTLDNQENPFGDENRNIYSFKAKATLNTEFEGDGSKLALAIPKNSATSVDWEGDSIGGIFNTLYLNQINTQFENADEDTLNFLNNIIDLDSDGEISSSELTIFVQNEESDDIFYRYDTTGVTEASIEEIDINQRQLDLNMLPSYTPVETKELTISIQ
jgi:hypothetical protein